MSEVSSIIYAWYLEVEVVHDVYHDLDKLGVIVFGQMDHAGVRLLDADEITLSW